MTTAIVTVPEAMSNLRLFDVTEEEYAGIEQMILAATEWSENFTRRRWVTVEVTEQFSHFPRSRSEGLVLPGGPVASVASVTYYDTDNVQQTWNSSLYRVESPKGRTLLLPNFGEDYPTDCNEERYSITATYTVGTALADVPVAAKRAVLLLVGSLYEYREEGVVDNAGLAVVQVPFAARALLTPLKVAL